MYGEIIAEQIREPTYYLLAALLEGPLHGYAIAKTVNELSEGEVRLPAGTLYGALDRLVAGGLLRETGEEVVGGRRRREYALTDEGRATVIAAAQRTRRAAAVVERRAGSVPTATARAGATRKA
jgi:DNA-binding PadR family transcriptional regulator